MLAEKFMLEAFQSTLPMKGATLKPHTSQPDRTVSIHAPNEGSDILAMGIFKKDIRFNPRSQ